MDFIENKNAFQNINKLNFYHKEKTQLMLEKIKLEDNPEYKNFLQTYFNDPSKYFLKRFNNNPIIVGKKSNTNSRYKVKMEIKTSPKKKIKRGFTLRPNKSFSDHSSKDDKKENITKDPKDKDKDKDNTNINYLKAGQRYVNDLELNEIFSNFKNTQKANKNKINNILTIKDIRKFRAENLDVTKSVKGKILMRRKTSKNLKGLNGDSPYKNNNNIKSYNNKVSLTENNVSDNSVKKSNTKISIDSLKKKDINLISTDSLPNKTSNKNLNNIQMYQNNVNYHKDRNINFSNESISLSNKNLSNIYESNKKLNNIFNRGVSNDDKNPVNNCYNYNFSKLYSTLNENKKIDIYKKQSQFLTTEKSKIYRKELAKKLVSQEKLFLNNLDSENKAIKMSLYMSNKLKIPKEKLLMNQTEYYRINTDLKSRLSKQMEYEYIEEYYEWEKNLKKFEKENKYEETIRDPKYKIKNYPRRNFYSLNNEYLSKRINRKHLKKFLNNLENIKYNFKGLFVKGRNLLEVEHDLAKGIKGKKILNNFEEVLPYSSLKNDVYAKHFQL